jgi:hypothetical protein
MGAGDWTPKLVSRALRLTAAALAAACWLAAPAGANGLLHGQPSTAEPPAAATDRLAATITSAGSTASGAVAAVTGERPVRNAVKTVAAARPVSTVVETAAAVPPVRTAAETVAAVGSSAPPAVGEATRQVRDSAGGAADRPAPPPGGSSSKPALRDTHGQAGGVTAQAARLRGLRAASAAQGRSPGPSGAPLSVLPAPSTLLEAAPSSPTPASGPAGADAAAAPLPSETPDPAPAAPGGGALSTGAASVLMGGLAVLLATLSLAGPALRRRLPRLTVTAWPSAFVPLLERPG